MNETKAWYLSKTIRSQIIAVLALGLSVSGVIDINNEIQGEVVDGILGVVGGVAQLLAIYGRLKASKKIK